MTEPAFLPPHETEQACAICHDPSSAHLPWQCPEYTQRLLDSLRESQEKTALKDTNAEVPWMQLYQRIVWLESQTHVLLSWKREVERDQSSEKAGSSNRQVGNTIPTNESHTPYESQDSVSMTDSAKRASHVSNVLNIEKTDAILEPPIHSERKKLIDACIGQSEFGLNGGRSFSQSPPPIEEHLDSPMQANLHRLSEREFIPRHYIFRNSSLDSLHEDGPFLQLKNSKGSKRTTPDFHDIDLNAFKKRSTIATPAPPPPPPQPPQLVQPPLVYIPRAMSPDLLASRRTALPEAPPPPPFSKDSPNQNQNKKNGNSNSSRFNAICATSQLKPILCTCPFSHVCLLCHQKGHILAQCVNRHPSWKNVCLYWNTENSCKKHGDCVHQHCCVNCLSPAHNFDACPHPIPYQSKHSANRVERRPSTEFEMHQRSNVHEMFNHSSPERFQGDRGTNGGTAIDASAKESKSREQLIEKLADAVFKTRNDDREATSALNIVGRNYQDVKTTHASRSSGFSGQISAPCKEFQRHLCKNTAEQCAFMHCCLLCGEGAIHGLNDCLKKPEFYRSCISWNFDFCSSLLCREGHTCLECNSSTHRYKECNNPMRAAKLPEPANCSKRQRK
ncbi:hypothetical protein BJ741DRAFT_597354 [Chytriomyces cf. hyalinus JEL632]|nr:hypothetical protein BJ741DRAFT_597354 [Chytriomyces cf. hyalinus JEL632]